jgi:hypothetical protein
LAKKSRSLQSCQIPIAVNTSARRRASRQEAGGANPHTARETSATRRTTKGKRKKRRSMVPNRRSLDQKSESAE